MKMLGLKTVVAGICLFAVSSMANSINELGTVVPGTPASTKSDQTFLTGLITAYNAGGSGSWQVPGAPGGGSWNYTLNPGSALAGVMPLPTLNGSYVLGDMGGVSASTSVGGVTSVTISLLGITSDYITIKWGQDFEAYYVAGLTGSLTLQNDVNRNGISGYTYWNGGQVPDGAATIALLGLGLSTLCFFARIFKLT
jgi:hypothetical protein